jgi:hypothetical protein
LLQTYFSAIFSKSNEYEKKHSQNAICIHFGRRSLVRLPAAAAQSSGTAITTPRYDPRRAYPYWVCVRRIEASA